MPPRFAYWTIIAGGLPTAFRATERDELMPTFTRLKEKHPDAEMKWFSKGKLWNSPDDARGSSDRRPPRQDDRGRRSADGDRDRAPREARGKDWRPGGEHRDPRQKFADAKKARNQAWKQKKFDRRSARNSRDGDDTRPARFDRPARDERPARRDRQDSRPDTRRDEPRFERPDGRGDRTRSSFAKPSRFDKPGTGGRPFGNGTGKPPRPRDGRRFDEDAPTPPHGDALTHRKNDRPAFAKRPFESRGSKSFDKPTGRKPPFGKTSFDGPPKPAGRPFGKGASSKPAADRPSSGKPTYGSKVPYDKAPRGKAPFGKTLLGRDAADRNSAGSTRFGKAGGKGRPFDKPGERREREPRWQDRDVRPHGDKLKPRGERDTSWPPRDARGTNGERGGKRATATRPFEKRTTEKRPSWRDRPDTDRRSDTRPHGDKLAARPPRTGARDRDNDGDRARNPRFKQGDWRDRPPRQFEGRQSERTRAGGTEEPTPPPRPKGPNREPRPSEEPRPTPPPRPSEPIVPPPGPQERGRLNRNKRSR